MKLFKRSYSKLSLFSGDLGSSRNNWLLIGFVAIVLCVVAFFAWMFHSSGWLIGGLIASLIFLWYTCFTGWFPRPFCKDDGELLGPALTDIVEQKADFYLMFSSTPGSG